jgi:hypothetical protein
MIIRGIRLVKYTLGSLLFCLHEKVEKSMLNQKGKRKGT